MFLSRVEDGCAVILANRPRAGGAFTISAETPDARDFMLTLLARWMTDRRAHLATATP